MAFRGVFLRISSRFPNFARLHFALKIGFRPFFFFLLGVSFSADNGGRAPPRNRDILIEPPLQGEPSSHSFSRSVPDHLLRQRNYRTLAFLARGLVSFGTDKFPKPPSYTMKILSFSARVTAFQDLQKTLFASLNS